jgi:hypothetical protein
VATPPCSIRFGSWRPPRPNAPKKLPRHTFSFGRTPLALFHALATRQSHALLSFCYRVVPKSLQRNNFLVKAQNEATKHFIFIYSLSKC